MRRIYYLILLFVFTINLCMAQGFGYEGKIYLGNGFYKVKSGNHYGIIDKNDNVIISVEYQDISFSKANFSFDFIVFTCVVPVELIELICDVAVEFMLET